MLIIAAGGCSGASGLSNGTSLPPSHSPANGPTIQVAQQGTGSQFVEFSIPTAASAPYGITEGPDGNVWFTETAAAKIGTINASGAVSEFPITSGGSPSQIVKGPDNNLWFTETSADRIGTITTSGALTEHSLPNAGAAPQGIASGPNGTLWFTEPGSNTIGRITTSGTITQYSGLKPGSDPQFITEGSDGNLWFTETGANNIGRITPNGKIREYGVPSKNSGLGQILSGNGVLYFVEGAANKIGDINTTNGAIREYANTYSNAPRSLAFGLSGTLALIGTDGFQTFNLTTHIFSAPLTPPSGAGDLMSAMSDDNEWFTEKGANKIGIYILHIQTATPSSINFTAVNETQTFTVHETNYSGGFSATSSDASVATVAPAASPANSFTVTAIGPGTATITVSDNQNNTSPISITVTTTSININ
jgi:virginiamycin B lyase